tara:strand:+ start:6251 stop:7264 length:1014 start_codon:yes stop_codon:yes gene_type:complete
MLQKNQNVSLSPEYITEYVQDNIPNGRLQSGGREWVAPSPFLRDDHKRHFSINTHTGLWQCFKTDKKGNFVDIYAYLEGISKSRAYSVITFKSIEENPAGTPDSQPYSYALPILEINTNTETYTPLTSESDLTDPLIREAFRYLDSRGIFPKEDAEYYVCREGKYANRLIIPYRDEEGEIYYFQARALGDQHPKYLNPGIDEGVRSQNVLYPFDPDQEVIVTEGPIDAISLKRCGLNATCTNGSNVSDVQALQLRQSPKITMAYDNDEAGRRGINKFDSTRKRLRMPAFGVYTVPSSYKDWNDFLCKGGTSAILEYLKKGKATFDSFYKIKRDLNLY